MDSSNAEKATSLEELRMTPAEGIMFTAGRVSRDAEVAELTAIEQRLTDHIVQLSSERDAALRALAESRARFADSEARRAELEAVIEKVRDRLRVGMIGPLTSAQTFDLLDVLTSSRSVVLEDRDREVAARAVEAAAGAIWPDRGPDDAYRASVWLRERAAAIRKGDTNA